MKTELFWKFGNFIEGEKGEIENTLWFENYCRDATQVVLDL